MNVLPTGPMGDPSAPHPRRAPARATVLSLIRTVVTVVLLTVLYFILPLDTRVKDAAFIYVVVGLVGVGALLVYQTVSIAASHYPLLRAIESYATSAPLYLLLFSTTYYEMQRSFPAAFAATLTRLDALYFTVTVFTTVGFGDITPHSQSARAVVTVQMLGNLIFLGVAVRLLSGAVQRNRQRQSGATDGSAPGGPNHSPAPDRAADPEHPDGPRPPDDAD